MHPSFGAAVAAEISPTGADVVDAPLLAVVTAVGGPAAIEAPAVTSGAALVVAAIVPLAGTAVIRLQTLGVTAAGTAAAATAVGPTPRAGGASATDGSIGEGTTI